MKYERITTFEASPTQTIDSESERPKKFRLRRLWCQPRISYTRGVRYLITFGGVHWIVDTIARHLGSPQVRREMKKDPRLTKHQFWRLVLRQDNSALLTAYADCEADAFVAQDIPYAACPTCCLRILADFDGGRWILRLPYEEKYSTLAQKWYGYRTTFGLIRGALLFAPGVLLWQECNG